MCCSLKMIYCSGPLDLCLQISFVGIRAQGMHESTGGVCMHAWQRKLTGRAFEVYARIEAVP